MKKGLFFISILLCLNALAQTPDDALRTAWFTQNGTARNIAIGGVNASLGGDITSANINPAGLGFYKTKEFVYRRDLFLIIINSITAEQIQQLIKAILCTGR